MDKFRIFINNIIYRYEDWAQEEYLDKMRLDEAFTMEEQAIIKLNRRSKDWEQAKYDADDKIAELREINNKLLAKKDKKIAELEKKLKYSIDASLYNSVVDSKIERIAELQQHIDCLENNPFRRIYNWVVSIVKYRIKVVKITDNLNDKYNKKGV